MIRDKLLMRVVYDYDTHLAGGLLEGLVQARELAAEMEIGVVLEYRQKVAVRVYPTISDEELLALEKKIIEAAAPTVQVELPKT